MNILNLIRHKFHRYVISLIKKKDLKIYYIRRYLPHGFATNESLAPLQNPESDIFKFEVFHCTKTQIKLHRSRLTRKYLTRRWWREDKSDDSAGRSSLLRKILPRTIFSYLRRDLILLSVNSECF